MSLEKKAKHIGAAAGSEAVPEGRLVNDGDTNEGLQIEEPSSSTTKVCLEIMEMLILVKRRIVV